MNNFDLSYYQIQGEQYEKTKLETRKYALSCAGRNGQL